MIDACGSLRRELGEIVFVWDDIAVPGDQVKGAMILVNRRQFSIRLVHDFVINLQVVVDGSHRVQKVPGVGQAMAAQRAQVRQLPHGSPHFGNVASSYFGIWSQVQAEANSSLDDADLAWLQEYHAHLRFDIQVSQLCADEEVAVRVAERSLLHARVDHVDIECNSFSDIRITASGKRVKPICKVDLLIVSRQLEWMPLGLLWKCVHFRVDRKETVLDMGFGFNGMVSLCVV